MQKDMPDELKISPRAVIDGEQEGYFICPICMKLLFEPIECKNCENAFCTPCINSWLKRSKDECPFRCKIQLRPLHRILKSQLDKTVVNCPFMDDGCDFKDYYRDIYRHAPTCQHSGNEFSAFSLTADTPVKKVCVFERDSKNVLVYDCATKAASKLTLRIAAQYPHNFQSIQLPTGRAFLVGGGDFAADPSPASMYKTFELNEAKLDLTALANLKYPRHGHSLAQISSNFIYCIGSRKDDGASARAVEMYNVEKNTWSEMPALTEGRHYHSSTSFNDQAIYVFCGISADTKKYINTIEVFTHGVSRSWETIKLDKAAFPPRQGSGVAQFDSKSILVLGGFAGKFLKYSQTFDVRTQKLENKIDLPADIFPFQTPTINDQKNGSLYSVDWQTYKIFGLQGGRWQELKALKR